MPKRDPLLLIADIEASLDKIARYLQDVSKDAFPGNEKTVDAVVRNLEIIGEAARQLPLSFKNDYPDIQWSEIAGLRNRIVHDYAGLDLELIWEICSKDLLPFKINLQNIKRK